MEARRLQRQIRYHIWANRLVGDTLADARPADQFEVTRLHEPSRRWFAHLVASDELWLSRIAQVPFDWEVWPNEPPPVVLRRYEDIAGRWASFLADLDAATTSTPFDRA